MPADDGQTPGDEERNAVEGYDDTAVHTTSLDHILKQHWGFDEFRPLQREAIQSVVAGRDSLLVLPTGGGKSLCFQAPALLDDGRRGVALVVSPLIALMKDQVDGLVASGVAAARLDSTMTSSERQATMDGLRESRFRLLYVSPERLVGEYGEGFQRQLARWGVRFVAIDEAHCISHWGHDFRPEYRLLGGLRALFPDVAIHAFTATATPRVRHDIVEQLGLRDPLVLVGDFDRPNLIYRVRQRTKLDAQIDAVLKARAGQAGIIYCLSRKEVDATARALVAKGHRALPYHAGLADEERSRNQEAFLDERADIVVATVAFGMGVDRSDVRFVIHAGAPKSVEHYQQEAGRAGRDGLDAECVLFYSSADFVRWKQMLEANGELTPAALAHLRGIESYANQMHCRHRALVEHFGQSFDRPFDPHGGGGSLGAGHVDAHDRGGFRQRHGGSRARRTGLVRAGPLLRRMRLVPRRTRDRRGRVRHRAEDRVVCRARQAALGHRARGRGARGQGHAEGDRTGPPHPEHVRAAQEHVEWRDPRLHRPADRERVPGADARRVSDAATHHAGRGAVEG